MVLHLSHHKSYHVYNAENIERVRRDEENARLEAQGLAAQNRQRDSEARLELLRSKSKKRRKDESEDALARQLSSRKAKEKETDDESANKSVRATIIPPAEPEDKYQTNGHINFWADLENGEPSAKKVHRGNAENEAEKKKEDEKWEQMTTMFLGKPAKELKPWYSSADLQSGEDRKKTDDQRMEAAFKDEELKRTHDPLAMMNSYLKQRERTRETIEQRERNGGETPASELRQLSSTPVPTFLRSKQQNRPPRSRTPPSSNAGKDSNKEVKHAQPELKSLPADDKTERERLTTATSVRENTERARAKALIEERKKQKRDRSASAASTPNSMTFVNQYNPAETRLAKRRWDE